MGPVNPSGCRRRAGRGAAAGRPWRTHGYGLGLMIGTTSTGAIVLGHTGRGPGSVIAVYHYAEGTPPRTAAALRPGNDEGAVESAAFACAQA